MGCHPKAVLWLPNGGYALFDTCSGLGDGDLWKQPLQFNTVFGQEFPNLLYHIPKSMAVKLNLSLDMIISPQVCVRLLNRKRDTCLSWH